MKTTVVMRGDTIDLWPDNNTGIPESSVNSDRTENGVKESHNVNRNSRPDSTKGLPLVLHAAGTQCEGNKCKLEESLLCSLLLTGNSVQTAQGVLGRTFEGW